jgi:hypothetical protein
MTPFYFGSGVENRIHGRLWTNRLMSEMISSSSDRKI